MQDQRSDAGAGLAAECVERVVLALLLEPGCRGPWSVAELGREIGSEPRAAAAVVGLPSGWSGASAQRVRVGVPLGGAFSRARGSGVA
jgi:hypothetical protein